VSHAPSASEGKESPPRYAQKLQQSYEEFLNVIKTHQNDEVPLPQSLAAKDAS